MRPKFNRSQSEQSKWAPATEVDLPEQVRLLVAFRTAETVEQQIALLEKLHARWLSPPDHRLSFQETP